ncbi:kinase [Candidatus Woesebacteria bacterium RBG_13_34_9]|uniref:Kinase n=1 Tax=Candidatus Woesebacteria bacterium RBG_13_34_9 TaxID=1802477 RepID=A0A1F7WZZ3_9BACT|nr:MAG: kinase [Candidatus Woesebacteria bacterium RBG_13_34_9]
MVITRTPFRISFFGGGTDYPAWYRNNGGSVLATTINKYCYLSVRLLPPFFWHKFRIIYSKMETCNMIDEIDHPAVREIIRFLKINQGLEIHHDGDLPARSGLGSSSALTVGLLNALHALLGHMPNKHDLAKESLYLEQEVLKETVGSQDQILAAHGGFNHITFHKNGDITLRPVTLSSKRIKELENHLMLFYTGIPRIASKVARSYVKKISTREKQLSLMQNLVEEALSILMSNKDIKSFGELLNEFWQIKKTLSPQVSNSQIDEIYKKSRSSGATGGKLIGAGGGGFLLLFVPPRSQKKVRKSLKKLIYVPFKFEYEGSQIIFFDREEDYSYFR